MAITAAAIVRSLQKLERAGPILLLRRTMLSVALMASAWTKRVPRKGPRLAASGARRATWGSVVTIAGASGLLGKPCHARPASSAGRWPFRGGSCPRADRDVDEVLCLFHQRVQVRGAREAFRVDLVDVLR